MPGWTEFEGLDLLDGIKKIIGKVILRNELGPLSNGYQLDHAMSGTKPDSTSGYSFGGNQMDLGQDNAEYNNLFIDILTNAKDSGGANIFTSTEIAEIEAINLEKSKPHYKTVGILDPVMESYKTKINLALSSSYGKSKINQKFAAEIETKTSYVQNQIIAGLPDGEIKNILQTSDELLVYLVDYDNQFGIRIGGKMHNYLRGNEIIMYSKKPLKLADNITPANIKTFKLNLLEGVENPTAISDRHKNTAIIISSNPVNTLTKSDTKYSFTQASYDTRPISTVFSDISSRFSSSVATTGKAPIDRGIKVESLATGQVAYRDTKGTTTYEPLSGSSGDDIFNIRDGKTLIAGSDGDDTYIFNLSEMGTNVISDVGGRGNIVLDTGIQSVSLSGTATYKKDTSSGKSIEGKWTMNIDGTSLALERGMVHADGSFSFGGKSGNDLAIFIGGNTSKSIIISKGLD